MIDAPSGGAPEQAPRWDLVDTESCGGGIRVRGIREASKGGRVRVHIIHGLNISHKELIYLL